MRHSKIRSVFISIGVIALVASCGGSSDTPSAAADFDADPSGSFTFWGFDNADDVGVARLDYAADQLPDLTMDHDATAFDAQKFTTRAAGGDVPDVIQMDRRFVTSYAAQGLIVPVDQCFAAHDVTPREYWYPSVVDDVTYQDQIWAVPQFYQPPAIIVNKRVLQAAGVQVDEIDTSNPDGLMSAIEKIYSESGGVPSRLGFDPVATGQPELWILGMGGQLTNDDGQPTIDDPSNIAGLEFLKRITDAQGGFARVKSFTDSFDTFGDNNQYVAEQVGAQVNAQWYPNVLAPYADELELEAIPFKNSAGEPYSVASGTAFVVPANSKNPAAGCAWMIEVTSHDAWLAAGEARQESREADGGVNTGLFTGSPRADQEIRENWVVETGNEGFDQVISTYYEVVEYGESFGSSPAGQDINQELVNAVTATLLGDKTPEQALADAQAAAMRAYENVAGE